MPEKISVDIGPVQETLFLPLWGRAVESRKAAPRLVDTAALEIMEKEHSPSTLVYKAISFISERKQTPWQNFPERL